MSEALAVLAFGDVRGTLFRHLIPAAGVPGCIAAGGLGVKEGDRSAAPFANTGHVKPPPPGEPGESEKPGRNPRRKRYELAFNCADRAAMQRSISAIRHGDQVVDAESLATSVAMELVAASAEHLAADGIRTGVYFQECVGIVFVVIDRHALEKRVAGGAESRGEVVYHERIIA